MIIYVMGVCASGKTTIGQGLASELGCQFYDGDDYHSQVNRQKMEQGIALTDVDRHPWLQDLANLAISESEKGKSAVIACSALKIGYRNILRGRRIGAKMDVRFVYLKMNEDQVRSRLMTRKGHFFNADLVKSQFETLEEPKDIEKDAITVDGNMSIPEIVMVVTKTLTENAN